MEETLVVEPLEDLITDQGLAFERIRKIWTNYKQSTIDRRTPAHIKVRLADLEKFAAETMERHRRIVKHPDAQDKSTHYYLKDDLFSRCVEEMEDVRDNLLNALSELTGEEAASTTKVGTVTTDKNKGLTRLPEIPLPKFNGELLTWCDFRDLFQSLVKSRTDLSKVEKFYYLKVSLVGRAAVWLQNVNVTADNFDTVWELLLQEYDHPRLIEYAIFDELMAIPPITRDRALGLANLRNTLMASYKAIQNLKRPIEAWDDLIVYLAVRRFDNATIEAWENEQKDGASFPSFQTLIDFMTKRIRVTGDSSKGVKPSANRAPAVFKPLTVRSHQTTVLLPNCFVCDGSHPLYQCPEFIKKQVKERYELLRVQKRCVNCFRTGHLARNCTSKHSCRECRGRHHTLLHTPREDRAASSSDPTVPTSMPNFPAPSDLVSHHTLSDDLTTTVIPTASVIIRGPSGACLSVRAILDPAAQASFIEESAAHAIACPKVGASATVSVTGGGTTLRARHFALFSVQPSTASAAPVNVRALVIKNVSRYTIPSPVTTVAIPHGIPLADDYANANSPVQLIIGADFVGAFLLPEMLRLPHTYAYLQKSTCGWVLVGNPNPDYESNCRLIVNHHTCVRPALDELTRFWELEEVPPTSAPISEEDLKCEGLFNKTHSRLPDGRYMVCLPFKDGIRPPGQATKDPVTRYYLRQEQRLRPQSAVTKEYHRFLSEYLDQGHMQEVPEEEVNQAQSFYLPHHPVFKREGDERKIRVVFNASYQGHDGRSLNDFLMVGPKLQTDIAAILLRWRLYQYVASTDISKMFRQILVTPEDRDYQRILWRPHGKGPVRSFRLNTVTYGTSCAPYLANRVLRQLADDDGLHFPLAEPVLRRSAYVDDLLFGADNPEQLRSICVQLKGLLMAGGFPTHKWRSNYPYVLPTEGRDQESPMDFAQPDHIRVLGIAWNARQDTFTYQVESETVVNTKRAFLSLLAKCYDPLGWVSPTTIIGKTLIQVLWQRKIDWDQPLPSDLRKKCQLFQQQLLTLNQISMPRWAGWQAGASSVVQLHGFADASSAAYAAVVYIKVTNGDTNCVRLLFAKTKVAPLKTLSVPRLELCAALLLARSTQYVFQALSLSSVSVHLYSDSTVVLAWLSASPSRWKTFVANRVSEIHTLFPDKVWSHVPSPENPADLASRGVPPDQLMDNQLWWYGPPWLREDYFPPPVLPPPTTELEWRGEIRVHSATATPTYDFPEFSSWTRLLRVHVFIFRFLRRCRRMTHPADHSLALEFDFARTEIYKIAQREFFLDGRVVRQGGCLSVRDGTLKMLSLFLDSEGVLRVGGRLRHSNIPMERKHPVLLPPGRLSRLLIEHFHQISLHGGLQTTLQLTRQTYWVLRARSMVRNCIRNCVVCVRHRATVSSQSMGDLPPQRVNPPGRPFINTGVDYAGPMTVRIGAGRGQRTQKAYCAVFVCLATRAIHLECVTDYSTSCFIAAFRRFVARRGLPSLMFSDNGTNFVGADRELRRNFLAACRDTAFQKQLATDCVQWNFIPPASPHFGGLWEAAVKSMKHHLRRVLGTYTPTLEELVTLLCQVEAILNSRPLTPLRDDPESYDVLTPGHFLTGTAILEPPYPSFLDSMDNRLTRWQRVQKQSQRFWKLWSSDYLNSLQQRTKWKEQQANLKVGELVVLKSPNLPPAHWELGRISRTFPGSDGLVRVVEVKTARSLYRRPISQLCRLPIDTK